MKIDLIANDGSPIGVIPADIYGKGVGGAELAMLSLMQTFADREHEVTVYNDPRKTGEHNGVMYQPRKRYNPRGKRDVLIVFRSPNPLLIGSVAPIKVWWSTDQYTIGSFAELSKQVDFCVTISPFHSRYHMKQYNIPQKRIGHIDLGVRVEDYDEEVQKIENRLIYCSVPDRGLTILHAAWPLILREVPTATLDITADYTLWGAGPGNAQHRLNWAGLKGVHFRGNVPRKTLVKLQQQAEILAYPCTYQELFCMSVAECQVAGALPITTNVGALPTTNQYGVVAANDLSNPRYLQEDFVDRVIGMLKQDRHFMEERRRSMVVGSRLRFDWNNIAQQWEKLFEEGKL